MRKAFLLCSDLKYIKRPAVGSWRRMNYRDPAQYTKVSIQGLNLAKYKNVGVTVGEKKLKRATKTDAPMPSSQSILLCFSARFSPRTINFNPLSSFTHE
jgi:hypothetical protein